MAMFRDQHAPDRGRARMGVGECIDAPVLQDAIADGGRKTVAEDALHEVAGEVPDQRFRGIAGQEEMGEMVHGADFITVRTIKVFLRSPGPSPNLSMHVGPRRHQNQGSPGCHGRCRGSRSHSCLL
jgi:hypothetical protein